jgi:hypothetical protein
MILQDQGEGGYQYQPVNITRFLAQFLSKSLTMTKFNLCFARGAEDQLQIRHFVQREKP